MSSVAFDKIVPLGQDFILDDVPVTLALKEWVALFLCLIDASVDSREDGKPCLGSCPGSQFAGLLDSVEHGSAPSPGNLRKQAMLNGIPFGAVRWVMHDPDIYAEPLGHLNETPLPLPAPCIVGASPVAEDEDGLGVRVDVSEMQLPLLHEAVTGKLRCVMADTESHVACIPVHVVYAIRHHLAVGECGIVVVVDLYDLCRICSAVVTPVRAKQFLFLRVNAEYWDTVLLTVFPQLLYLLELLVAQLAVSHWQGLHRLAAGVPFCLDDLPDGVETYVYMILLCEYALYLRGCQPEPFCVGILWKPRYVKRHNLAEDGDVLGMDGKSAFPATSLFANSALIEVLFGLEFLASSVDCLTVDAKDAADKAYTMPAIPFCYNSSELPRLSLVRVSEVLHFLVCYYICWNFRCLHNCLESSYKGTNFSADLRIQYVNNQ